MKPLKDRMRWLLDLLRRRGESREDAEDLIQEAFLRLHVYCRSPEEAQQKAFLRQTVQRLAIDRHRRAHAELYVADTPESLTGDAALMDLHPTPDEDLAIQQRLMHVEQILNGLPPRTREIFLRHRLEGHSCSQIAQSFGISVSAVEKHIARSVLALMDVVENG